MSLHKTLAINLEALIDGESISIIDYNCPLGTYYWVKGTFPDDIKAGKLFIYREGTFDRFFMSHAKNVAHLPALRQQPDVVVNLDSDNLLGPLYLEQLRAHDFTNRGVMFPYAAGAATGRIACRAELFLKAGGYDEDFIHGYGYDDSDFAARAGKLDGKGAVVVKIDKGSTFGNSGPTNAGQLDPAVGCGESLKMHGRMSRANLANKVYTANANRRWGVASVIDVNREPLEVGHGSDSSANQPSDSPAQPDGG